MKGEEKMKDYEMIQKASFREKYAMKNGNKKTKTINGHKCYVFTYSSDDEYQDANGATYDTVSRKWID